MTALLPYLYSEIETYNSILNFEWVTGMQTIDPNTSAITARTFSVLDFGTVGAIEFRSLPPPSYPENVGYYTVKRVMTDNRYSSQAVFSDNAEDPAYEYNDFYGWTKTKTIYLHEAWYLDILQRRIVWEPELFGPDPNTGLYTPTGEYLFRIYNSGNTLLSVTNTGDAGSVTFSCGPYWGARVLSSTDTFLVHHLHGSSLSTGRNITTDNPATLDGSHIKITKEQGSIGSISIGIYGQRWLGTLEFHNIETPELLIHPPNTDHLIRLKPPGLSNVNDNFKTVSFPNGTIQERTLEVDVV